MELASGAAGSGCLSQINSAAANANANAGKPSAILSQGFAVTVAGSRATALAATAFAAFPLTLTGGGGWSFRLDFGRSLAARAASAKLSRAISRSLACFRSTLRRASSVKLWVRTPELVSGVVVADAVLGSPDSLGSGAAKSAASVEPRVLPATSASTARASLSQSRSGKGKAPSVASALEPRSEEDRRSLTRRPLHLWAQSRARPRTL
jgi:hypothetical protein